LLDAVKVLLSKMAYFKKEITTVVLGAHFLVAVVEGWVVNNSYISRFSV